jgi:hypothetical protein
MEDPAQFSIPGQTFQRGVHGNVKCLVYDANTSRLVPFAVVGSHIVEIQPQIMHMYKSNRESWQIACFCSSVFVKTQRETVSGLHC